MLASYSNPGLAARAVADFHVKGYAVERRPVFVDGRDLERLVLPGFVTIEAARAAATRVETLLGIEDAWAWQNPE